VSERTFSHFGLIVTGDGEVAFLADFLRAVAADGGCHFKVIRKVGQRSPRGERAVQRMVGSGKLIPDRDQEEIGLPARDFLRTPGSYVVLVDDLESARAPQAAEVFSRYRHAFDTILVQPELKARSSVHFMVMMIEAYYFAHSAAINKVFGTNLQDEVEDVETMPHPKNKLKGIARHFDEIEHGKAIVQQLDLAHVLARPETCASLRTLVAWCQKAKGVPFGDEFCLANGRLSEVTKAQLDALPG
jgi:hypothetical protein